MLHRTQCTTSRDYKQRRHGKRLNKYIGYNGWGSTKGKKSASLHIHPSSYSSSFPFFYFYTPPSFIPLLLFSPLLHLFRISIRPFYYSQPIMWASVVDGTYGWSQLYQHSQQPKQLLTPTSWGPAEPLRCPWGFDVNGHTGNSWWTSGPTNGQGFVMALSTPEPAV